MALSRLFHVYVRLLTAPTRLGDHSQSIGCYLKIRYHGRNMQPPGSVRASARRQASPMRERLNEPLSVPGRVGGSERRGAVAAGELGGHTGRSAAAVARAEHVERGSSALLLWVARHVAVVGVLAASARPV